jgi:hypothetical protein
MQDMQEGDMRSFESLSDGRMPPKLDDEIKRINMVAPAALVKKIDDWRRLQPDLPNLSEAIRRLCEIALKVKGK